MTSRHSEAFKRIWHGSNPTIDTIFVIVVVIVLVVMCASLVYAFYTQPSVERDEQEKKGSGKSARATVSSVAFQLGKRIGLKQTDLEPGTTRGRLQRQGTVGTEWYKLFEKCDQYGNGRIPADVFAKFVQDKALELSLNSSEASKVAREADMNGDGFVDFTEFAEKMTTVRKDHFVRALPLKMSRLMTPRRRQADAAREALDYGCCPPPIFLAALALLEVGVFLYQQDLCGSQTVSAEDDDSTCLPTAIFAMDPEHPFQVWRYMTNVLVHYSTSHLANNVIGQLAFGTSLELAHRWRIVAVFLLGAITASLFESALTNSYVGYGGGASGGVFAICAAHVANVALNWNEMNRPIVHVALVACFMFYTLFDTYHMGSTTATSYSAHIGGFIAGILLGILFLRHVVKGRWESKTKKAALILYIALVFFCIAGIVYRTTDASIIRAILLNG